jgi:hypothetical protein
MHTYEASSAERARVREHIRTMLRKLSPRSRPRGEAERNPAGSDQKRVKSEREEDGS